MNAPSITSSRRTGRIIATPRARRAMNRQRLDPTAIKGSGPGGRIVEADVLNFRPAATTRTSSMRRAIARRASESFATVPHFYLRAELDAKALLAFREQQLDAVQRECGVRLTLTDLLLRAMALALRDCPYANCIWQNDGLAALPTIDIGMVVGLDDGLLIPVFHKADQLTLPELVKRRNALVEAARSGSLPAEATQGGATSLSNLGNSRVDEFQAIISPLQSSILAVGRAVPRQFVVDGELQVRPTLRLCLSVDHRVMDGAPAAVFLGKIVERLEQPGLLAAA